MDRISNSAQHSREQEKYSERSEFQTPSLDNISKLVGAGVFAPGGKPGGRHPYRIDSSKALSLLPNLRDLDTDDNSTKKTAVPDSGRDLTSEELARLKHSSIKAFSHVVKTFIGRRIISSALEAQIERLVDSDGVQVGTEGIGEFRYFKDTFPADSEKAVINVGYDIYKERERDLKNCTDALGIGLTEDKIRQISLTGIIAHEYGHAVERTIELMRAEQLVKVSPQGNSDEVITKNIVQASKEKRESLSAIGDDPSLQELIFIQEGETISTWDTPYHDIDSERFASGLEILGLRFALEDADLNAGQVADVINNLRVDRTKKLDEFKAVTKLINSKDLDVYYMRFALRDLKTTLINSSTSATHLDIEERIPEQPPYFPIGYYIPFSETQVKQFIDKFPPTSQH